MDSETISFEETFAPDGSITLTTSDWYHMMRSFSSSHLDLSDSRVHALRLGARFEGLSEEQHNQLREILKEMRVGEGDWEGFEAAIGLAWPLIRRYVEGRRVSLNDSPRLLEDLSGECLNPVLLEICKWRNRITLSPTREIVFSAAVLADFEVLRRIMNHFFPDRVHYTVAVLVYSAVLVQMYQLWAPRDFIRFCQLFIENPHFARVRHWATTARGVKRE